MVIFSLEKQTLFWPNEDEKTEIKTRIEHESGFPSCLGFVDGTLIPLRYKPSWHGEDFYSRKASYSLSCMIVCDDQKLIRHVYTGWAGSSHDARVYSNSPLGRYPDVYFGGDEYLLADSAYQTLKEVIPAYKKPVNGDLVGDNAIFNYRLSMIRVRIEHCIGILKNRFESLRSIRKVIRSSKDVARISVWIRCCCILHNLLLKRGDYEDFMEMTSQATSQENHVIEEGSHNGFEKREIIKKIILRNN